MQDYNGFTQSSDALSSDHAVVWEAQASGQDSTSGNPATSPTEHPGILLWDDHEFVRQAIRALLEREGFTVMGEVSCAAEAARLASESQPAVAIINFLDPLPAASNPYREFRTVAPDTKIIVLTDAADQTNIVRALGAGASGYVARSESTTDLVRAVVEVLRGNIYVSPPISKEIVRALRSVEVADDELTLRERQVVQLIAEGFSTKQISELLGITHRTTESHRGRAMRSLDIHDVAGLVLYAIRRRLIEP